MYFDGIWEGLVALFIAACIVMFGLGMLVMWALPKLWELIKPWIHHLTA